MGLWARTTIQFRSVDRKRVGGLDWRAYFWSGGDESGVEVSGVEVE